MGGIALSRREKIGWIVFSAASVVFLSLILLSGPRKAEFRSVSLSYLPDTSGRSALRISEKEWCEIPGIGKGLARKISEYQKIYGLFTAPDETKLVDGIGEKRSQAVAAYAEERERSQNP